MKTIKLNMENTIIINKSKFIGIMYHVNDNVEIINILMDIKKRYSDATHICYGYICGNLKKCSDDKEPSGTAGIPILNILEKNNLNYVLCIVVRYFGGIKLGASGLLRAYSNCVLECLKKCDIVSLEDGYKVRLYINYDNIKNIDMLLRNSNILYKEYNDTVIYEVLINKKLYDELDCKKEIIDNVKISV